VLGKAGPPVPQHDKRHEAAQTRLISEAFDEDGYPMIVDDEAVKRACFAFGTVLLPVLLDSEGGGKQVSTCLCCRLHLRCMWYDRVDGRDSRLQIAC
jgi:hypothetical protein